MEPFIALRAFALMLSTILFGCAPVIVERQPLPEPVAGHTQVTPPGNSGAIYNVASSRFLFEDRRARRVGDLITIILAEETVAAKSASTSSSKDTSINVPAPTLLGSTALLNGNPALTDIDSGTTFSGSGDSSQSNSLRGNITVKVTAVTNNGNLTVSGKKLLTLNQGKELISISGIVRAADLSPHNTINSNQIADARIVFSGNGLLADSNRAGWLTRFFNSALWPF